jgi:hypothetical protein
MPQHYRNKISKVTGSYEGGWHTESKQQATEADWLTTLDAQNRPKLGCRRP